MNKPIPTKAQSLQRLISNIPISCVVDVGVQESTHVLIKLFPDKRHYLIEPVYAFFPKIEENYKEIDHVLLPYALSDEESEIYLVMSSIHKNGVITHSHLRTKPPLVDGKHIVESKIIKVHRFDQLDVCNQIPDNFLCKIDVDGQDLNVAKGFGNKLLKSSVIIIEATSTTVLERMSYISMLGFELFDIVDLIYYGNSLYQFDLVFIRSNLVTEQIKPKISDFKSDLWQKFI